MADIRELLDSPEYVEAYRNRTGRNKPAPASGPSSAMPEFDYDAFMGAPAAPAAPTSGTPVVPTGANDPQLAELLKEDESSWYDPRSWLATEEGANLAIGRGSRAHIGAYDDPTIRMQKLEEAYGAGNVIADPNDVENFIIKEGDSWKRYNPRGLDLGDLTSVAIPEVAGGIGAILGAAGGATVAAPTGPGAIAAGLVGSGAGYATGRTLGRELASALYGDIDNPDAGIYDAPGAFATDVALGAVGEGAGRLIGRGATGAFNYVKNKPTLRSGVASVPGFRVPLPAATTDTSISKAFQGAIPEDALTTVDANAARAAFSNINPADQSLATLVDPDDLAGIYANARQAGGRYADMADKFTEATTSGADRFITKSLGMNDPNIVGSARAADVASQINRNREALKAARNAKARATLESVTPLTSNVNLDAAGIGLGEAFEGLTTPIQSLERLPLGQNIKALIEGQVVRDADKNLVMRPGLSPAPLASGTQSNLLKSELSNLGRAVAEPVAAQDLFTATLGDLYTPAVGADLVAQERLRKGLFEALPGYEQSQAESRIFRELMNSQEALGAINRETDQTTDSFLRPISNILNGNKVPDLDNVRRLAEARDVGALTGEQIRELAGDMISAIGNKMTTRQRGNAIQNLTESERRGLAQLYTIANTDPSLYGRLNSRTGEILPEARRVKMTDWLGKQNLDTDIERTLGDIGGSTMAAHSARAAESTKATNEALRRLNLGEDIAARANRVEQIAAADRGALAMQSAQALAPAAAASSAASAVTGGGGGIGSLIKLPLGVAARYVGIPRLKAGLALGADKRTRDFVLKSIAARKIKQDALDASGATSAIGRLLAPDTLAYRRAIESGLVKRQGALNTLEDLSSQASLPSADITDAMPNMTQFYLPDYLKPSTSVRGAFSRPSTNDMIYQSTVPAPLRGYFGYDDKEERKRKGAFR